MNVHTGRQPTAAEAALVDTFAERMGELPGDGEVISARDNAVEALKQRGLPSRRVEAWHYTDLRTLLRAIPGFDPAAGSNALNAVIPGSAVATVSNGVALTAPQVEGVSFAKVSEQLANGSLIRDLAIRDGDDAIGQINAAYVTDGWSLVFAEGTELAAPVELQNTQLRGQGHVRFPVQFGKGVKATIIERQSGGEGEGFSTSVSNVAIADDADITWIILREHGPDAAQLAQFIATLGTNAKLTLYVVNAGGKLIRQEVHVLVKGEGSDFQLRGVNLLAGDSHTDVTMTLGHLVENTTSVQVVRNVVTDRARGVFQGQIKVNRIAQKTDARMACNTLLLSDDGEFDAKPELEIFADDVACGHGATVTEIDANHLFYLKARGIPENEARGLLIKAFVAEIIEELEDEQLVEALEAILEKWLAAHI
ncbi:Fe-S cluster assembly protein SufD [Phyllobacterium sp. 0TCS1.6C]|uniref:Fe-S cluster assembly protein SufD n=1 Tax=unclassified Phyllobacterium TaxID=2638441 RepID=UPI002263D99E|nr:MULTISPECIES: Fe-S cluster assembly protein SufD [unclassified Phyllobacterium]MCX8282599.1 Fe-S cluster assembly protein SufD [Phyllobacterium sp. 0TCS1.6C]MCX8294705.1 Fe-S cluster assembly protein SufD [Phyllobacterium sp. 0TCS1.6A]